MPSSETLDYEPATRLVYGDNSLNQLGELASEIAENKVLLVTDAGVRSTGHVDRAAKILKESNFTVEIFDRVIENPTTREVDICVEVAREFQPNLIIGLGGGSSLDTAKGCNFILWHEDNHVNLRIMIIYRCYIGRYYLRRVVGLIIAIA